MGASTYPKAALRLLPGIGGGRALPGDELTRAGIEPDRRRLAAYQRVCGFRVSDVLPATYPHLLAFPLAMELMTRLDFPFGVVGLVHTENAIERLRPVHAGERLDVAVRTVDLRPHPRGRQFDVAASAAVDGEPVWRSRTTYLHREAGGGSSAGDETPRHAAPQPTAIWSVPGDAGRRYAAVSGDWNPIHLHPLTSRAFGFPRPIAHGMWVAARCLAALEGHLGDAYDVRVRFKLPLPLPGRAAFSTAGGGDARAFAVTDARTGRPHVAGVVAPR